MFINVFSVFVRNGIADGQPRSGPAIFNDVTSNTFVHLLLLTI